MSDDTALAVTPDTPLPMFTGAQMTQAFRAYRDLQRSLDQEMPDQIMQLDGRPFRKKGYWRALAVAFNITPELLSETREVDGAFEDGSENFGWRVIYRVTAPNGRQAIGDGACFAHEKGRRSEWKTRPPQATVHNVLSHAHTRALNRAISNLVAFGEVSAEEVERDDVVPEGTTTAPSPPARAARAATPTPKTKAQPTGPEPKLTPPKCPHCGTVGTYKVGQYGGYYSCPDFRTHAEGTAKWFLDVKRWEADPRSRLTLEDYEDGKLTPPSFMREPGDDPPF